MIKLRRGVSYQIGQLQDLGVTPHLVSVKTNVERVELGSQLVDAFWILDHVVQQAGQIAEQRFVADEHGLCRLLADELVVSDSSPQPGQDAAVVFAVAVLKIIVHDVLEVREDKLTGTKSA